MSRVEPGPVVVRADDPRRAEFEARDWHVTARSWGAQLDRRASDPASLRDLVARVADVAAVRELGEGDAPAVLALDAATRDDYPGEVATAHRPLTRDRATPGPSRRAFGALASGELVAMTFLDVDESRAETDFTTVAAPWRGRGLGTAVKAASVLTLVAEGVTRFRTGGSADNGASVAMNRRVGYVLDEEWITMAPPTETETPAAPGGHPGRTTTIWHLAHQSDWRAAIVSGSYRVSTRGASLDDVGFIHGSRPHQLAAVAEFVYAADDEDLCVLVMDEQTIRASGVEVREEDGGDGELYPHIHGPIDPAWVLDVRAAWFDSAGRFMVGEPDVDAAPRPHGPDADPGVWRRSE